MCSLHPFHQESISRDLCEYETEGIPQCISLLPDYTYFIERIFSYVLQKSVPTHPGLRPGFLAFRLTGECYTLPNGRVYQRVTGGEEPHRRRFAVGSPRSLTSTIKNTFAFIGEPSHSFTGFRVLVFEKSHSNCLPTVTRFALTISHFHYKNCSEEKRNVSTTEPRLLCRSPV